MGEKKSYYRRMREKMIQALKTFTFMRSHEGRYTAEDYIHDHPDEIDDNDF